MTERGGGPGLALGEHLLGTPATLGRWRPLVAALGGILIAAGGAPLEAFLLPWAGVALVHCALIDAFRDRRPLRAGGQTGLCAGFAANAVSMGWAIGLFEEHAFLAWPLATLLAALLWLAQSLPFVLAGVLGAVAHARLPARARFSATPLAIVLGGTLGPMFFPWRVGTSQTALVPLAAWAFVGGVGLVDAAITTPAVLLTEAIRAGRRDLAVAGLVMLGVAVGGGALLAQHRADARDAAPRTRIGVAHTILSIAERHTPMRWERDHLALLAATSELEAAGAELVLWPETAYPFQWPRSRRRDPIGIESIIARGVRGPVVLGSITHGGRERYNSVIAIGADGALLGIVDKRVLMPFSERIPFYEQMSAWHDVMPGSLTPAARPGVLVVGGVRVGVLNCYEDLSDAHTRWLAELSPDVLTNHTNDAWFGEHGAMLHLFLSRMRAIETGRDLVRAVNGGYSAHVAWTGEVVAERGPEEPGTILAEVRIGRGASPFVRAGDWVGAASLGAMFALLLARRR